MTEHDQVQVIHEPNRSIPTLEVLSCLYLGEWAPELRSHKDGGSGPLREKNAKTLSKCVRTRIKLIHCYRFCFRAISS